MTRASKGRGGKPAKSRFGFARIFPVRPESRLFLFFVLLMVGLVTGTALASHDSQLYSISRPGTAMPTKPPSRATGSPNLPTAGTTTQPATLPADTSDSDQGTAAPAVPPCDQGKNQQAMDNRQHSTTQEKSEHDKQVSFIETTGIVTRLVSPGTYSTQMDNENIRHNNRVSEIEQIFLQAMHDAHCD